MHNARCVMIFIDTFTVENLKQVQQCYNCSDLFERFPRNKKAIKDFSIETRDLDEAIRKARNMEWQSYLDSKLSSDDHHSEQAQAIRDGLNTFADPEIGASYEIETMVNNCLIKSSFRDLVKKAAEIIKRRTIIVLPDSANVNIEDAFVTSLGEAIYQKIINNNYEVGLLRLCNIKNEDQNQYKNLYNRILDNILIRVSADQIKNARYERVGPILLEGETGTGKSMGAAQIAQMLNMDLITVNIAAVTEGLLESTIRGHIKGAFSGAHSNQEGAFEKAHNKILFLDELQSASLSAQTQLLDLLNAVSNKVSVSRLGTHDAKELNVKLIMAINKPLSELLKQGKLRYDLYHRVRQIVHLPSFKDKFKDLSSNGTQMANNYHAFLKALLSVYRWRWLDPISLDESGFISAPNPFINIENLALDSIRAFEWPGNFRQFERFAHDLFEDALVESPDSPETLSLSLVERLITKEKAREGYTSLDNDSSSISTYEDQKLRQVEEILASANYRFDHCKSDLKLFGLGSRQTLYRYLEKNWDKLSITTRLQSNLKNSVWKDDPLS